MLIIFNNKFNTKINKVKRTKKVKIKVNSHKKRVKLNDMNKIPIIKIKVV